jgi:hypothetical protein
LVPPLLSEQEAAGPFLIWAERENNSA